MNKPNTLSREICPICCNEMSTGCQSWHYFCSCCAYEKATLEPNINMNVAHALIDEDARETGLRTLRVGNFQVLISHLKSIKKGGGRLLEVGCAHGWFLEASRNDFDVLGVEPDEYVFNAASKWGLPIRQGFFPDALSADEKFDVIVFNDVIEHIPDVQKVLQDCHRFLNDEGLLLLNLPSNHGVFYRLSKLFCRLGLTKFFDRLWQKGLPSPHLHYFNSSNLTALLQENKFAIKNKGNLSTLRLAGLYTRISYTTNHNVITRVLVWVSVALCLPILHLLPSDIMYVIASRNE